MIPPLRWSFRAPTGTLYDLSGDFLRELGVAGAFAPTFDFLADDIPIYGGERVRAVVPRPRQITVPILARDPDEDADRLHDLLRALVDDCDPTQGPGTLIATRPDGTARQLDAYYAGGMEVERSDTAFGGWWQTAALIFRAPDPYWTLADPISLTFTSGTQTSFFPLLPMVLNSDRLLGKVTVTNDGVGPAYPIWTARGPLTSVTLASVTLDTTFTVTTTLAAGQSVKIDTRPGHRSVRRDDGTNLYPSLTGGLWALGPRRNALDVALAGATADSQLTLVYSPRYGTP